MARRRLQNPEPYMNKNKTLWKASLSFYVRDSNGEEKRERKQITLGRTATMTKREAMRELRPYVDKANASAFAPACEEKTITFDEFSNIWMKDYLSLSKPSTQATMRGHVKKFKEFFGSMKMRQITPADVQRFISNKVAEEYEPKTVRNFWITFKLILDASVTQGYRETGISKPKLPKAQKELTCPSFCTSGHERVYITAVGCEICFGTTGLQAAGAGGL